MTIALVLGGAACLWPDLYRATALGEFDGVVACNDAAAAYPGRLDAAVSLHAEKLPLWLARRARRRFRRPARVIANLEALHSRPAVVAGITHHVEFRFDGQDLTGSSGLFALKVALVDLGFDRAVLCGVPMDGGQGHFNDPAPWDEAAKYRAGWAQALPEIGGRARSMSGWTAEILGRPDATWIGGH